MTGTTGGATHNRIAASQPIRSGLYHSWYKQVPTHCLLLCAIEAGDLLDSVKKSSPGWDTFASTRGGFLFILNYGPPQLSPAPTKFSIQIPFFTRIYPIIHFIRSGIWHSRYVTRIGKPENRLRTNASGIVHIHIKPPSKKKVIPVFPPERIVK